MFCACLYISYWMTTWHVAAKAIYVKRNELLLCAHDVMQWVSVDRNVSDTASINKKAIAKIQTLYAYQD